MVKVEILDENYISEKPLSACIGNFDGVHAGHQELIRRTLKLAGDNDAAVITFDPEPSVLFSKDSELRFLTDKVQKYSLFEQYGINTILEIPFTQEFAEQSPDQFIKFLNKLNIRTLVCGFDWTFGCKGEGTPEYLINSELRQFDVEVCEPVKYARQKISSSRIKEAIKEGKIKKSLKMLNHPYVAICHVEEGKLVSDTNVLPEKGTYQCRMNSMTLLININSCTLSFSDDREIEITDCFSDC